MTDDRQSELGSGGMTWVWIGLIAIIALYVTFA